MDDPYTFGAISAANSLSDIYAMGGIPHTALAIAGFSSCDYEPGVLREILRGAMDKLKEASVYLLGGHSIEDRELKFGLSVSGVVKKDKILRLSGAIPGDVLILTKPIGVGILTTALKGGRLLEDDLREAVQWMLRLNNRASAIAMDANAHAVTDVTGFGLLGHAFNMVRDAEIDIVISYGNVPVLDNVEGMVALGMVPEGDYNNLKFLDGRVLFPDGFPEEKGLILSDPQTSGGLLIAIAPQEVEVFSSADIPFSVIGRVEKGDGKLRVIS